MKGNIVAYKNEYFDLDFSCTTDQRLKMAHKDLEQVKDRPNRVDHEDGSYTTNTITLMLFHYKAMIENYITVLEKLKDLEEYYEDQ